MTSTWKRAPEAYNAPRPTEAVSPQTPPPDIEQRLKKLEERITLLETKTATNQS